MYSRRATVTAGLAALGAVAGCTWPDRAGSGSAPESPDRSPTDSDPSTSSPVGRVVRYVYSDTVPADATALVVSRSWRNWLRTAAEHGVARGSVKPEDCGRSPLAGFDAVRLVDAGDRAGRYRLDGETGGYFERPLYAERADPPSDATVHALSDLPEAVHERFTEAIDSEGVDLPPQNPPYQFVQERARESEDAAFELWVRQDGTTYRLYSRYPTITPPCGYYVVLRLSPADDAEGPGLSLADTGGSMDTIAADAEAEVTRELSKYSDSARSLLHRYEYVMTVQGLFLAEVIGG